jgi:aspartate 4-decarboxylase
MALRIPFGVRFRFVVTFLAVSVILSSVASFAEIRPLSAEERSQYNALSPFEFKDILIKTAEDACAELAAKGQSCRILNAGRGNPNFMNTTVREAFSLLHSFAAQDAAVGSTIPHLGFRPAKKDISGRLETFLKAKQGEAARFLENALAYCTTNLNLVPDDVVFELTDAALGDVYPEPPRMLANIEKITMAYLEHLHFRSGVLPKVHFDLFATEGASAAMVYIFKSLNENKLLNQGDAIAVVTPIFSPYLEIPLLNDYQLTPIYIRGKQDDGWQIPSAEIDKLKDPKIKALFMVNPMNPGAASLNKATVKLISALIKEKRKDLIVLTDTVYAPFVDEFHDVLEDAPENTIGVYSFSKYFGVTGWRLGVIMVASDNVLDRALKGLSAKDKAALRKRYAIESTKPEEIPFIERIVMDSRDVSLAHTGGLSTPQQAIMALFSLFELIDKKQAYKKSIQALLDRRMKNYYAPLGNPVPAGPEKTGYYDLIDLERLALSMHGEAFAKHITSVYSPFDLLLYLAREKQVILLPGAGFAAPPWTTRISLANLDDADYTKIGKRIRETMDAFFREWLKK